MKQMVIEIRMRFVRGAIVSGVPYNFTQRQNSRALRKRVCVCVRESACAGEVLLTVQDITQMSIQGMYDTRMLCMTQHTQLSLDRSQKWSIS